MKTRFVLAVLVCAGVMLSASADGTRVELTPDLFVEPLAPGVWRHVSTKDMEDWGPVAANGLVIVSGAEAALIDTPWTDDQVQALAKWLDASLGAKLTIVIPTHWHADCLGGLSAAHASGAASYASNKTIELAKKGGMVAPENGFSGHLDLSVGSIIVALEEVGPGHTIDNIVVWLPEQHILFGGCLVKNAKSKTLGYTDDADLERWPSTLEIVANRFSDAEIVVPGHGAPGGRDLLTFTKELIERLRGGTGEKSR